MDVLGAIDSSVALAVEPLEEPGGGAPVFGSPGEDLVVEDGRALFAGFMNGVGKFGMSTSPLEEVRILNSDCCHRCLGGHAHLEAAEDIAANLGGKQGLTANGFASGALQFTLLQMLRPRNGTEWPRVVPISQTSTTWPRSRRKSQRHRASIQSSRPGRYGPEIGIAPFGAASRTGTPRMVVGSFMGLGFTVGSVGRHGNGGRPCVPSSSGGRSTRCQPCRCPSRRRCRRRPFYGSQSGRRGARGPGGSGGWPRRW